MLILIAGKPNSGKTHCIDYLKNVYENIFIVDEYVNEIYQVNQIGYDIIKNNFGEQYVTDLTVNKKMLGDLVINDQAMNNKLRELIWPLIRDQLKKIKNTKLNYIIEMAIYDVDFNDYFENLFDVTIQIKSTIHIANDKSKFNALYRNSTKQYDHVITNRGNEDYISEVCNIINSYFA